MDENYTYQDWLKAHMAKGGGYEKIVWGFINNEELMKQMSFFEIKKEK